MGILNRLLLLPLTLLMMALSAIAAAAALHLIPESLWLNELRYALSRQEFLAVCAAIFLLGLNFFFAVFAGRSDTGRSHGEIMIVDTPAGAVQVELSAIRGIVERVALGISGVREVSAAVSVPGKKTDASVPLQVELKVVLAAQAHLSAVSEQLTARIQQDLMDVLGIEGVPVAILVTDVSNVAAQSKRRVM